MFEGGIVEVADDGVEVGAGWHLIDALWIRLTNNSGQSRIIFARSMSRMCVKTWSVRFVPLFASKS